MSESIVKLLKKYLCSTNVAQEEKKDFFVEKLGGGNFFGAGVFRQLCLEK